MWTQRIENVVRESSSFSGLHEFFTKVERLLMTEELYDEVHNVTIKPAERKIDEQSPFGHYLQHCLEQYFALEDDEFAKVVRALQRWVEGKSDHSTSGVDRDQKQTLGPSALKRGDYSMARAELEGFFDQFPLDSSNYSLQENLLRNATFHYLTKAYESARSSLEESLRLSRGVNDLSCISACDDLLRRIDHEDVRGYHQGDDVILSRSKPSFSLQDLWHLESLVDAGQPLLPILAGLGELIHQGKSKSKGKAIDTDQGAPSKEFAECCLCEADLWSRVGVASNTSACQEACFEERRMLAFTESEQLALPTMILQSQRLTEEGRYDEAISTLLQNRLLQSLDMVGFTSWQAQVWRALYSASLHVDSAKTMNAIRALRPEVAREVEGDMGKVWNDEEVFSEPNEASFDRKQGTTLGQELLGELKEAREIRLDGREPATSLQMAAQVMRRAADSDLFPMYRKGVVECAESLLALGNVTRSRELMDGIMPQLLVESSVEMRGLGAWVYARILLTLHKHEKMEVESIFPWLQRAKLAFQECHMVKELSDVLYVQARLSDHLGRHQERDETERDLQTTIKEWESNLQTKLGMFDAVQSIVRLVGAHVVAGA
ncbi:hypothetical protein CBS101457_001282 [Exobasidium rhododendri]|nr:hypothetical protein CBS101457_001282 [Exobasidium rhododendri]